MICRLLAIATALTALSLPATADTELTRISPSIILLGSPAPSDAMATLKRGQTTDVLAGGERRIGGIVRASAEVAVAESPVSQDEKTSAIGMEPEGMDEAEYIPPPSIPPLGDSELRMGQ